MRNAVLAFQDIGSHVFPKPLQLEWAQVRCASSNRTSVLTNAGPITLTGSNIFQLTTDLRLQGEIGGHATNLVGISGSRLDIPFTSWTEVTSGTFDPGGRFTVSLPIDPAEPRQFYAIRTP